PVGRLVGCPIRHDAESDRPRKDIAGGFPDQPPCVVENQLRWLTSPRWLPPLIALIKRQHFGIPRKPGFIRGGEGSLRPRRSFRHRRTPWSMRQHAHSPPVDRRNDVVKENRVRYPWHC